MTCLCVVLMSFNSSLTTLLSRLSASPMCKPSGIPECILAMQGYISCPGRSEIWAQNAFTGSMKLVCHIKDMQESMITHFATVLRYCIVLLYCATVFCRHIHHQWRWGLRQMGSCKRCRLPWKPSALKHMPSKEGSWSCRSPLCCVCR